MKKYKFICPYDMITTIEYISKNIHKPVSKILEDKVMYGKIAKNKKSISLHYGTVYANAFRPIFVLRFKDDGANQTSVRVIWRLPVFTIVFSIVWFIPLIKWLINGVVSGNCLQIVLLLALVLFYIALSIFGIWIERNNVKCILEYVRKLLNEDI